MAFYGMYNSGVPTHQYYTLSLVNPPKSDITDQFPIEYRETRNSPFLADPQSYYASVVRFSCTTPLLPIFIPAMKNETTGETEYSITMHHPSLNSGVPVRRHVFFRSDNPYVVKDLAVKSSEYYYVYQPNDWIAMVNETFATCWEALIGAAGAPYNAAKGDSPFIQWLDNTSVGNLWVPYNLCQTPRPGATFPTTYTVGLADAGVSADLFEGNLRVTLGAGAGAKYRVGDFVNTVAFVPAGYNATGVKILTIVNDTITLDLTVAGTPAVTTVGNIAANTPISIYMNASMFNLFSSFTAQNQSSVLSPAPANGMHWKLVFAPTYAKATPNASFPFPQYGTVARASGPALDYTYICQQYSTIPLWNPVSSFVFITSILPINPESISAPYTAGATLTNAGNNSAVGTVLTDFEIPLDNGWETKPTISYSPSAEYRLVDMNGNSNLNNIQISIGWRNKLGVFIPLNIGPNGYAQIKLLFRKRDYNGI